MQSPTGTFAAHLGLVCLLLASSIAQAADAGADPRASGQPSAHANAVRVTTALMVLPVNHVARVALIQATPGRARLPVLVRFKDATGNVLGSANGILATNQPVIAAVQRGTVVTAAPVLVQAEVVIGPVPSGLGLTSCPVHFSMQTTIGNEDGPLQNCIIDTCLNVSPGTSPRNSVSANCSVTGLVLEP